MARKRRCSVCHRPGHDRRAHKARPTRRNVDFFSDGAGVHPVRDSYGYREWLTNSDRGKEMRTALRKRSKGR